MFRGNRYSRILSKCYLRQRESPSIYSNEDNLPNSPSVQGVSDTEGVVIVWVEMTVRPGWPW